MKIRTILAAMAAACAVGLANKAAFAQWSTVNSTVGNVPISAMLQLSDGTVMGQVNGGTNWQRLTPDSAGSYASGSWSDITGMNYSRTFYSSAVLQSGKVFVAGGEYGTGKDWVEIYDPVANSWTDIGPNYFGGIADGNCEVLNSGNVLDYPQAPDSAYAGDSFIFDPSTYTWSSPIPALNPDGNINLGESSWVKLPDDSILTVDSDQSSYGAYTAERYVPSAGAWTNAGTLPVSVWFDLPNGGLTAETGPAFLLPNGNAIFFGGSGHTAIYLYPSGNWIQGPDIPNGQDMGDAPGAMMPNGKILLCVGPMVDNTNRQDWLPPVSFYEYDYSVGPTGAFTQVLAPGNSSYTLNSDVTFPCEMLVLPSGNVLFTDGNQQLGSQLYIYQMDSPALAAGQPTIYSVSWNTDGSLHLTGTLFNGISEGAAYGDDQQMATDFPLVRFTDGSGNVYYGRTYNWSSTSVQAYGRVVSTECSVPATVFDGEGGSYSLQVVANGNASGSVGFYGPVWVDFVNYNSIFQFGTFSYPFATLPQGVSAVTSGGTIAIDASSQPSDGTVTVPYTISTPMTIISVYGPSTVQ